MMEDYQASIKNVTTGEWLSNEKNGVVECSDKEEERLIFSEEEDAESTLAFINDIHEDCFTLILEESSEDTSS